MNTFSDALEGLKRGELWARDGWNGKGMFVFLVPGSQFQVSRPPLLGIFNEGTVIDYAPHLDMKLADGRVMTWTPAQIDLLSSDWKRIES